MSLSPLALAVQGLNRTPLAIALQGFFNFETVPPAPVPDADRFPYAKTLTTQGRYAGDPTIARLGQRINRKTRW